MNVEPSRYQSPCLEDEAQHIRYLEMFSEAEYSVVSSCASVQLVRGVSLSSE